MQNEQSSLGERPAVVDSRWSPGVHVQNDSSDAACPTQSSATIVKSGYDTSTRHANNSSGDPSTALTESEVGPQLCSICQTLIQSSDPSTSCDECHLPFHIECWEENLGCSAYGCQNVNALRSGPDIQINSPPPLPSRYPGTINNNASCEQNEFPWEHVLLAASALGTLLGLLCFGIFAIMAGAAVVLYFVANGKDQPSAALAASLGVSLIGFIVGVALSILFWW